jgi:hypothetical protein
LKQKGAAPRVHCNTIFFLAALESERMAFEALLRRRLAYERVEGDKALRLTPEQQKEVKDGLKRARGDLAEGVRRLYRQLFIPAREGVKELDLGIPTYGEQRAIDEEVYDKLRLDGEILERIVPLVIKERYLREREWVATEQLAQAGLRTPGETRVVSREAWEAGIAEGVDKGLFGLGELEGERAVCRYFKTRPLVGLVSGEVLIRADLCQAQQAAETRVTQPEPGTPAGLQVCEGAEAAGVTVAGEPAAGAVWTGGIGRRHVHLRLTVPRGKVSGLMGVMNLLQHKFNRLEITLLADEGSISEQEYEDKIREAFRQLGIEVGEE